MGRQGVQTVYKALCESLLGRESTHLKRKFEQTAANSEQESVPWQAASCSTDAGTTVSHPEARRLSTGHRLSGATERKKDREYTAQAV